MKERSSYIIKKFYESKNHQKKQINTGGSVLLNMIPTRNEYSNYLLTGCFFFYNDVVFKI